MIYYSGSEWWSLMVFGKLSGSVFPRAAKFGGFSAALAFSLKWIEHEGILPITSLGLLTQSAGFSMFSATLAFVLVFRTSQCYSRFWHCATSVSTMRAQMAEAASSLITFTIMSKAPAEDIRVFRHTLVRLFSLLHAMCLSTFCDRETHFPIIDMESFHADHLRVLKETPDNKERVDVVYMWINAIIIKSLDNGLLNIPPPILSRVFQEMEKAMVEFHQVMQVMTIPFPFPYAQMAVVLLMLMVIGTPISMCYWTDNMASAGVLTFIAILCLTSLEIIADELDNPFGIDDNDLPCEHFQQEMNSSLILLLKPEFGNVPKLKKGALNNLEASLRNRRADDSLVLELEKTDGSVAASPASRRSTTRSEEESVVAT